MKGFIITGLLGLIGLQQAEAQTTTIPIDDCTDQLRGGRCIEDEYIGRGGNQDLTCEAKDIKDVSLQNVAVIDGCSSGMDTATFSAQIQYEPNANTRYDIGLYIPTGTFGVGSSTKNYPFTGVCDVFTFACGGAGTDPYDVDGDRCGDRTSGVVYREVAVEVQAQCTANPGTGEFELPYCFGYANSKGDGRGMGDNSDYCSVSIADPDDEADPRPDSPLPAVPQTPSKCVCGFIYVPEVCVVNLAGVQGGTCDATGVLSDVKLPAADINLSGGFVFEYQITAIPADAPGTTVGFVDYVANTDIDIAFDGTAPPEAEYTVTVRRKSDPEPCEDTLVFTTPQCCADTAGEPDDTMCNPPTTICCPDELFCDTPNPDDLTACGDPHMTGFLGQKFDFTGEDGAWYTLVSDDNMHVNMRVTTAVADLPEITYITGLSVLTTDSDGFDHSIVIEVQDPHNLDSSCPAGVSPCLADGSLTVTLDGEEALAAPGTVSLGADVQVSAVNLPGACRTFGFEKYWERKKLQSARHGRRLREPVDMGEWILADPTATNMDECTQHVAQGDVFAHQSEHASFQIVTPKASVRLSHGRLHQIAMRDPTDQFDLPDHLTWQMNVAIDHNEVSHYAKGVLGETFVPTLDVYGKPIMTGMGAIRGTQEDYRVEGALGQDARAC